MALQSTTPLNKKSSNRRGLLVTVGGVAVAISAAMMSGTGLMPTAATVATQSAPAPVVTDKVCEGDNCTTQAAIDAQIARLQLDEHVMTDDGIECRFVDDVGRAHCVKRIASIKERRG